MILFFIYHFLLQGSDITAASLKLAECQETILNLGKQLKALATPTEAALFDKVFNANGSTTTAAINKSWNRRFSLRDQMLAEDTSKPVILRSPTTDAKDNSNNMHISNSILDYRCCCDLCSALKPRCTHITST